MTFKVFFKDDLDVGGLGGFNREQVSLDGSTSSTCFEYLSEVLNKYPVTLGGVSTSGVQTKMPESCQMSLYNELARYIHIMNEFSYIL